MAKYVTATYEGSFVNYGTLVPGGVSFVSICTFLKIFPFMCYFLYTACYSITFGEQRCTFCA